MSHEAYGKNMDENIAELVKRLKAKRYRAVDIRRVTIPKPDGGQRPLGILVLEDKIVQRGVVKILSAIYEQGFLDVSFGFRENRHAHEALRAMELVIMRGKKGERWFQNDFKHISLPLTAHQKRLTD